MIAEANRRQALTGLIVGSSLMIAGRTLATGTPTSTEYRDFFSPELPDLRALGTQPATSSEVKKAASILSALPQTTPFAIFSALAANRDVNGDGEFYCGGWRQRWNPLIVTMFNETSETPSGDETAWCAASLNWALHRAGLGGSGSAGSGSFRDFPKGSRTSTPQQGDIVVFHSADIKKAKLGHGHVGLFVDKTATHIQVLGGNQINRVGHHEFSSKPIPFNSGALVFDTFHSISAFARI